MNCFNQMAESTCTSLCGFNRSAIASVDEMKSARYRKFIETLEAFATAYGLRVETTALSKAWEYPWVIFNSGLSEFSGLRVVDIGSELSPVPWFLMNQGADVTLVERNEMHGSLIDRWLNARNALGQMPKYSFVPDECLPFDSETFDLVTSFSVIEHQPNKIRAISEAIRVLKSGGTLAISFDICEPSAGMTYPPELGTPLTLDQFERLIWFRPEFDNAEKPKWNTEDIPEFIEWHRRGKAMRLLPEPREEIIDNPRQNYVVGAAVLNKL